MPATVKQLKYNGSVEVLSKYAENDTKGRKISALFDQMQSTIDDLKAVGRFLSVWNAATGLPETNPPGTAPYSYHYITGDYFIVGVIDDPHDYPEYNSETSYAVGDKCTYQNRYYICNTATSGTWTSAAWTEHTITNYKPSGTIYTGAASSAVENEPVKANDFYRYDGNGGWILIVSTPRVISFSEIAGNPSDNDALNSTLNEKLDKITYGSGNNLIFFPGTTGSNAIVSYNTYTDQEKIWASRLTFTNGSGGNSFAKLESHGKLSLEGYALDFTVNGKKANITIPSAANNGTFSFPEKQSGTFATTSDIQNSTITIQKNGSTVDSFTLNQASNKTINLDIPVKGTIASGSSGYATGGDVYDKYVELDSKKEFIGPITVRAADHNDYDA